MDCRQYMKKVVLMMDGELEPDLAADIEHHMSACADCRGRYEAMLRIDGRLEMMGNAEQPALASVIKRRIERRNFASRGLLAGIPAVALAAFLAIGIGHVAGKSVGSVMMDKTSPTNSLEQMFPVSEGSFSDILTEIGPMENSG